MFAPEGYSVIGVVALVTVAAFGAGYFMPAPWNWLLYGTGVVLLAFTLFFFRDPERVPPAAATAGRVVLAPADGKVVLVEGVDHEPLYLHGPAKQVSIFLSPLNVHVNRSPAAGVIEYDQYVAGEYLVAWHPKASEKNERSQLGMMTESGFKILFKQIAGKVARRVVYNVGVGDSLRAGERFGIVKFGSRMDILLPPAVEVTVVPGDRVTAGESIIANVPVELMGRTEETPGVPAAAGTNG